MLQFLPIRNHFLTRSHCLQKKKNVNEILREPPYLAFILDIDNDKYLWVVSRRRTEVDQRSTALDYLFGMSNQLLETTAKNYENVLQTPISHNFFVTLLLTRDCKGSLLVVCEQQGLGEDLAALVSSSTRFLALDGLVASEVACLRSAEVTVADLELPACRLSLSRSHCKYDSRATCSSMASLVASQSGTMIECLGI